MLHYIDLQYYMLVLSFKILLFRSLIYIIYSNPFHNLSKSMEFVNLIKHFKYLFTSSLFSFGHLSCFVMFLFRTSLSLCNFGHSYIRWSTVWLPDDSIILNLWRQSFVFPWAVTIAVKLGVKWNLFLSLSLMFGKNCFVISPFVVWSHWFCY